MAKYTRGSDGRFTAQVWDGTYRNGKKHYIKIRSDKLLPRGETFDIFTDIKPPRHVAVDIIPIYTAHIHSNHVIRYRCCHAYSPSFEHIKHPATAECFRPSTLN